MGSIGRRWRMWQNHRKFAKTGKRCRIACSHLLVDGHVELGDHCRFRDYVVLRTSGRGRIIIGDYSGLSFYTLMEATRLIKIGSLSALAEFTVVRDTNHFVIGTDVHWRITPHIAEPVVIGDAVLIGSRCYIHPGVTIGDGAVLGAGSVLHKDMGPYEVWAGNPARRIAHRTRNISEAMQQQYADMVARYGISPVRQGEGYLAHDEMVREAARQGRNRAMELRAELMEQLASELTADPAAQDGGDF
jgi:acetyltransferase-like isoleucine patch superfamily enzyme